MKRSSTQGIPSLRLSPPSRLSISTRFTGRGSYRPANSRPRILGQCSFRYPGSSATLMPSTPALPLLRLTRASARFRFSRSHTCSINSSPSARLSLTRFAIDASVPWDSDLGASPSDPCSKASLSWVFCRPSSMRCSSYSPCLSSPRGHRSDLRLATLRFGLSVAPSFDCGVPH